MHFFVKSVCVIIGTQNDFKASFVHYGHIVKILKNLCAESVCFHWRTPWSFFYDLMPLFRVRLRASCCDSVPLCCWSRRVQGWVKSRRLASQIGRSRPGHGHVMTCCLFATMSFSWMSSHRINPGKWKYGCW